MTVDQCQYCRTTEGLRSTGLDGGAPMCWACTRSILWAMANGPEIRFDDSGMPVRGLSDPVADKKECISRFISDQGLDLESPEHEDRSEDFQIGIIAFGQGTPKPDEEHDTLDLRAGWQAGHDVTLKRCHEEGWGCKGSINIASREPDGTRLQSEDAWYICPSAKPRAMRE